MPRLFIAVDLPPDRTDALAALRDDALEARWTPAEQLHITLRFIGDVEDRPTEELRERLRDVAASPFALAGVGLDVFPSRRRPRVLVARVGSEPFLARLRDEIDRIVVAEGFEADTRPFNPHVTFARLKRAGPRAVRHFLKAQADLTIEPFRVTQFHLYRSDLKPSGAQHTVIESYDLDESR